MIFRINRISSTHQAIAVVLLIFGAAVSSPSQTTQEKAATASISGKVTMKNKGLSGVVVMVEEQNQRGWRRPNNYRGTTDQTGSYKITNVPAGTYTIRPVTPSLAIEDELTNGSVVVSEDEPVENINFSMVPGGVITGRITDTDGKPLIEEHVTVMPLDPTIIDSRLFGSLRTDDRGIYRAFGLRKGKYKVSVGQEESFPVRARQVYRQTFYPSVVDGTKATLIEVTEGSETKDVDIVVGRPLTTFNVSGRVLDAETGKPLANIKFGVFQRHGDHGSSSSIGPDVTNAGGEFRLENVGPGKYSIFVVPGESGVRGDSVSFDVVDRDVTDLVIHAGKDASASGVVVFEGAEESERTIKPNNLFINAWVESSEENFSGGFSRPVNPDGSFKVSGLRKGVVRFGFTSGRQNDAKQIETVRVERDGVVQPRGLILNDGEQVTGLRVVVKYLTGVIHGQIKVEGDELLPNARMSVWLTRVDESRPQYMSGNSPQVDSRKRFVVEGLAAGTYEVNVAVFEPSRQDTNRIYKQQVTVVDNAISEVTIVIKTRP